MRSTQRSVMPRPVPTLVTVQPMVTRAGSWMVSVGAVTLETCKSAYGASATVTGAVPTLSFSALYSTMVPPASVRTSTNQSPDTSTGSVTVTLPPYVASRQRIPDLRARSSSRSPASHCWSRDR